MTTKSRMVVEHVSQKRAVQTRQKIVEVGFQVISEKGYHNVTVDVIAKEAGVSTGIAYRYFKNKKDILMAVLEYAFENIKQFSQTESNKLQQFESTKDMMSYVLEQFNQLHIEYYAFHEELEGMRHTDPEVKALYDRIESETIDELIKMCPESVAQTENLREKIVFVISTLETYCHIVADEKYERLDKDILKKMVIKSVEIAFEE